VHRTDVSGAERYVACIWTCLGRSEEELSVSSARALLRATDGGLYGGLGVCPDGPCPPGGP